jgi:hypothetical protein
MALNMANPLIYYERLSSSRTEALFVFLSLLFFGLFLLRLTAGSFDILAILLLAFFLLFLFYSFNYRTLRLCLSADTFSLQFGLFTWHISIHNIASCYLDKLPALLRYGGAGIHFYMFQNRYRASFNFLEFSRVALSFRKKVGPLSELSFSTRHPEEIMALLQQAAHAQKSLEK